jgi:hypothetical protein
MESPKPPPEPPKPPRKKYARGARDEPFCLALAEGLTIKAASIKAGFSAKSNACYQLKKKDHIRARVAELRRYNPFTGSDLRPVIGALMEGARDALEAAKAKQTAAIYVAATRMLAEAARLKQKLPAAAETSAADEWLDRWGPKS